MTIAEAIRDMRRALAPVVGEGEAREMAEIIVEDIKGYTKVEMLMYADRELLPETVQHMRGVVDSVIAGEPLQYTLGAARWRGRQFTVTPAVLIPRPETAQLVDMIVDDFTGRSDMRVLDIGTGSGCIAVSLALDMAFPKVDAVDISSAALQVAKDNASALKARVRTIEADAFALDANPVLKNAEYDVIVSNPPYILDSERPEIDPRVKDHEPRLALFVPDTDPIGIYTAIATYASAHLAPHGRLYFEINPLCVDSLCAMLRAKGFTDVESHRDYKGNIRFVTASR